MFMPHAINFDKRHIPEMADYLWCDIINKVAYKGEDQHYCETHNALFDAMDELYIMEKLGYAPSEYPELKA